MQSVTLTDTAGNPTTESDLQHGGRSYGTTSDTTVTRANATRFRFHCRVNGTWYFVRKRALALAVRAVFASAQVAVFILAAGSQRKFCEQQSTDAFIKRSGK